MGKWRFALRILACLAAVACPGIARARDAVSGQVDLLELRVGDGPDHLAMESTYNFGRNDNRFVFKVDGGSDTRIMFDSFEVQALYARQVGKSTTVLVGLRQDFHSGQDHAYMSLGVEARLAPWLDGEHYAYLSQDGDLIGGAKLTGHWPVTASLTIEPRLTVSWSAQTIPAAGVRSGVTDIEGAVRIRQMLNEQLDVYLGVMHNRLIGRTRAAAIASNETPQRTHAVVGMGFRF